VPVAQSKVLWTLVCVEAAVIVGLLLGRERVLLSDLSPDRTMTAQVVAQRDFPYLSVQGYLVIQSVDTPGLKTSHFLVARDTTSDVIREVRNVQWEGSSVKIEVAGIHYAGPTTFDSISTTH
jgi:hypothetical protein